MVACYGRAQKSSETPISLNRGVPRHENGLQPMTDPQCSCQYALQNLNGGKQSHMCRCTASLYSNLSMVEGEEVLQVE